MRLLSELLSPSERRSVAEWLGGDSFDDSFPDSRLLSVGGCSEGTLSEPLDPFHGPRWNGWGGLENRRYQSVAMARLSASHLPRLETRWVFGFPAAIYSRAQPTLAGGRVFVGSADGRVYALDARTGCIAWIYRARGAVRASVVLGSLSTSTASSAVAFFGDQQAFVYAVDAMTGEEIWARQVDPHPYAVITAAPQFHGDTLFVPVSSQEEIAARNPAYGCCTFRGSVVALAAADGTPRWQTYTIPEPPAVTGTNARGVDKSGPSGAAVWSSPTIDVRSGALYVATGDNYSDPATAGSDAIFALDLDTGRVLWSQQMTPNDAWNAACAAPDRSNCPRSEGPDWDFGASPILETVSDEGRVLIAGQKSGVVHALDPDRQGAIVWQTQIGQGGGKGKIVWGPSSDGRNVYVALSVFGDNPAFEGGLHALRITDGSRVWFAPTATGCKDGPDCGTHQVGAAVTSTPGIVFSGAYDGVLRALDAADGSILWEFQTARSFDTVNGVPGRGGAINAAGAVVVGGMVFVASGDGLGAQVGNVLIALDSEE